MELTREQVEQAITDAASGRLWMVARDKILAHDQAQRQKLDLAEADNDRLAELVQDHKQEWQQLEEKVASQQTQLQAQAAALADVTKERDELLASKPTKGTESKYLDELRGAVALPDYMPCSMVDFARSLRVMIEEESRKPIPDTHLVGVLCNAARVGWEMLHAMRVNLEPIEHLQQQLTDAQATIQRLSDLLYGARCVYCGEVVGKDKQNQDLGDEVLRQHVLVCEKHPAFALKQRLATLEGALQYIAEYWNGLENEMAMRDYCHMARDTAEKALAPAPGGQEENNGR